MKGGINVEEVKEGHGPLAKTGKTVSHLKVILILCSLYAHFIWKEEEAYSFSRSFSQKFSSWTATNYSTNTGMGSRETFC